MDSSAGLLASICAELERGLGSGVLQGIFAPDAQRLYLDFRVPGRSVWVHLCCAPGVERVSVVDQRPASPAQASGWQQRLRKALIGARLEGLLSPRERTVALALATRAGPYTLWTQWGGGFALLGAGNVRLAASPPGFIPSVPGEWKAPAATAAPVPNIEFTLAKAAEVAFAQEERLRADAVRAQGLARALKKLDRTIAKVELEAQRHTDAERLRAEGELLKQHAHALVRGQKSVTLMEWTSEGEQVERLITLDPARAPFEHAPERFRRYKRLLRGSTIAATRLIALRAERESLTHSFALKDADSPGTGQRSLQEKKAAPYRVYLGHGGRAIWVGKGARGNDVLTFEVAGPHHAWLHARGVPGAHVVVPMNSGEVMPQELLLDAAHLAAHHSDFKGEPKADIAHTLAKYVRKAKGGAPGAVMVDREKTFVLRVDPQRLQKILATEV